VLGVRAGKAEERGGRQPWGLLRAQVASKVGHPAFVHPAKIDAVTVVTAFPEVRYAL
jgi:hypothetical protein